MNEAALESTLRKLFPAVIETDVSLAAISRWRVGGHAKYVLRPSSSEQIAKLVKWFKANNIPYLVIGSTSNLLFSDQGLEIPAIKIGRAMADVSISGTHITCQSGAWVPGIARKACLAGLTGIEHICGIPGTMGGLVCMNGGSQRRSIGENIVSVQSVTTTGEIVEYTEDQCGFAYRTSAFQKNGNVITACTLRLNKGVVRTIRREMLGILRSRRKKFPQKHPNCGSVFVSNPEMYVDYGPPGAAIEKSGLKGKNKGDALISPLHANFIVNTGKASANDILYLIHLARSKVREKTGYDLVAEARYISPHGDVIPAHIEAEARWGVDAS